MASLARTLHSLCICVQNYFHKRNWSHREFMLNMAQLHKATDADALAAFFFALLREQNKLKSCMKWSRVTETADTEGETYINTETISSFSQTMSNLSKYSMMQKRIVRLILIIWWTKTPFCSTFELHLFALAWIALIPIAIALFLLNAHGYLTHKYWRISRNSLHGTHTADYRSHFSEK